jgi:4,5-dihydroxyphthalate decarboxylase
MQLKTVTRTQGNNQALKEGSVKPRTFAFDFVEVPVLVDAFRRMVRGHEFDICEMRSRPTSAPGRTAKP